MKTEWKKGNVPPEAVRRILLQLPSGKICSGRVTETRGFEPEYVDNLELLKASMFFVNACKWVYVEEVT